MENTLENKAKFFGCHYGCDYFRASGSKSKISVYAFMFEMAKEGSFLELKPLSSITDEDCLNICGFQGKGGYRITFTNARYVVNNMKSCNTPPSLAMQILDYLRSKGYALPYMGLSVDKLVQYGWIKLKEA